MFFFLAYNPKGPIQFTQKSHGQVCHTILFLIPISDLVRVIIEVMVQHGKKQCDDLFGLTERKLRQELSLADIWRKNLIQSA